MVWWKCRSAEALALSWWVCVCFKAVFLICQCACVSLAAAAAAAKSLHSCPTLCDPIDGSPPGSPIPGTLQARTLEWVAISSSNAWKWKVKVKSLIRVQLFATPWTAAHQAPPSLGFSRQEHWSGLPFPSPMHESEKWKWSRLVLSDSSRPHGDLVKRQILVQQLWKWGLRF